MLMQNFQVQDVKSMSGIDESVDDTLNRKSNEALPAFDEEVQVEEQNQIQGESPGFLSG